MNTQEGDNVRGLLRGQLRRCPDRCQAPVPPTGPAGKLAGRGFSLSSANSINWGQRLPQIVYYISAYCDLLREGADSEGERINVCVPTGNWQPSWPPP